VDVFAMYPQGTFFTTNQQNSITETNELNLEMKQQDSESMEIETKIISNRGQINDVSISIENDNEYNI
jgi:hypothetical protein